MVHAPHAWPLTQPYTILANYSIYLDRMHISCKVNREIRVIKGKTFQQYVSYTVQCTCNGYESNIGVKGHFVLKVK